MRSRLGLLPLLTLASGGFDMNIPLSTGRTKYRTGHRQYQSRFEQDIKDAQRTYIERTKKQDS